MVYRSSCLAALCCSAAIAAASCSGESGADGPAPVFDFTEDDGGHGDPPPDVSTDAGTDGGGGAPVGSACESSAACREGLCLRTERYPGGYCTRLRCRPGGCSGEGAVCATLRGGTAACVQRCDSHAGCRDGYACRRDDVDASSGVCLPGRRQRDVSYQRMKRVVGVDCDPREGVVGEDARKYHFTFQVGPEANGFLMVPFATEGTVRPLTFRTPTEEVDLLRSYRHHNSRIRDFNRSQSLTGEGTYGVAGFDWPIGVPYAPQYEDLLVPGGQYELTVRASDPTPCLYVIDSEAGRTLDLNFYFAGTERVDAESAPDNSDFQAVLRRVGKIYGRAGIEIGTTRYFSLPDDVQTRFKRIESRRQAQTLLAFGQPPNRSLEGHLSADVFLVQDFSVRRSGEGQVLGMSAGVPGAAGFHGNARNGLVFQISDLGRRNDHVAHIMAHELGHFLGLRHTTEMVYDTSNEEQFDRLLGATDPIGDTATCANIGDKVRDDPRDCPDFDNLLFPFAPPPRLDVTPRLTDGQARALEANPLTR